MILDFLRFPGLVLLAGAWILPLLKGRAKRVVLLLLPAVALASCIYLGMTFSAAGDEGLPVGTIQQKLGIPGSTLTHHISHLKSARVIRQERQQATLICRIEYALIADLVEYLTQECCADAGTRDDAA